MNLLQQRADLPFQLAVFRFERFYPGQMVFDRRDRRALALIQEIDADLIVLGVPRTQHLVLPGQ